MTTLANSDNPDAMEAFVFPASFGQKRLWPKNPRAAAYNIPDSIRIFGPFDLEAFRRSVQEIMNRHEALRTRFAVMDGEVCQVIETDIEAEVPVTDLGSEPPGEREGAARRMIQDEVNAPFDLYCAPLWRIKLFRLGDQDHVLVLVMHHIISDGWSIGVILEEISLLYSAFIAGKPSPLSEPPIQYADFSEWERESLQEKSFDKHLAYWKEHLSGTTALNLPYDRPKGTPSPGGAGSYTFSLEKELVENLTRVTQEQNVSLNMILLAAYQTLLYRYTGQQDIVVGCNVARRNWPSVKKVVGLFAHPLALRGKLSGELSFYELLAQVKETTLAAYTYQDVPFALVLKELAEEHDPQRPYIFQTMFNLLNLPPWQLRLGPTEIRRFEIDFSPARMDISIFAIEQKESVLVSVLYDHMFNAETIAGMFQYYAALLRNIIDHPEKSLESLLLSTSHP
jgi:NRPS condensation-like uncharacterized protein